MKELIAHTEFLVLQHNCVVVPGLGGFVLNHESAHINKKGLFVPPNVKLGFNSDLKHNDGLLANSYAQRFSISYDIACHKIDTAIKELVKELSMTGVVSFGRLGTLRSLDGRMVFEPNINTLYFPTTWGLSVVDLKQLDSIESVSTIVEKEQIPVVKKRTMRKVLISVGSVAAAIALLFAPVSRDSSLYDKVQQSGFFVVNNKIETAKKITDESVLTDTKTSLLSDYVEQIQQLGVQDEALVKGEPEVTIANQEELVVKPVQHVEAKKKEAAKVSKPLKTYYIIIGGDTSRAQADRILAATKNEGFKSADLVSSADRHRIYVASFDDKDKANAYLDSFRKKYPAHKDAWLLSKRN